VTVFGASSTPLASGELALGGCWSMVIGGTETGIGIDPRAWGMVARLLRTARFDILHLHEPLMPLVPWFAVLQSDAPMVATFHTHREQGHRWYSRYGWLLAPLVRRLCARLAVSDAARRTTARYFPGEYHIVPNGIDIGRFQLPTARPVEMPQGYRYVLFVGRLEPRKGVSCLIRAMTIVQRQAPDARLVLVGEGPDRVALETTARGAGLDVTFTGRVSDDLLPAYYRAADVVCSPALGGESFGIVLLEAMAAERAIVATQIEGYAELVSDAGCVRLVAVNDPTALATEIAALLHDPGLRRQLGERGAAFVRDYDWMTIAHRLEAIYSMCTARDESRPPC
jgi:phosphatidylinositol alpha-mannosyltransferase